MSNVKIVDPYLIERIPITKNIDYAHLLEVGGVCPLCGKYLLASKGKSKSKLYQIAHIYPNSPLEEQQKTLSGLERLGETCEDFNNKIALCKDCHGIYDDSVTKEEYLKLVAIKKQLLKNAHMKIEVSNQNLEDEIVLVLNSLNKVTADTLKEVNLKYKGVKIKNKFEEDYQILRIKIESYVCEYYNFISEVFKNLETVDKINFNIIASEINTSYLKCQKENNDKNAIFNALSHWLQSKIEGASVEACEVVIAFFVQNCEVFDEITK